MALLDELNVSLGKRTRLYRMLYEHGPGNGTLLFLPIDQGLEHGPRDFFPNPDSEDPEYQLRIALEGGFSGIVFQVGIAQKYMRDYVGRVPLVLKINGKTSIPDDAHAFSPLTSTVEDAVRIGADAVGYTLYVGSPAQDRDFLQFEKVRREAERYGMPLIVWAYPRGEAVEKKGGRNSFFAVHYAARVAQELGADIVKLNMPNIDEPEYAQRKKDSPKPYDTLDISLEEAMKEIVKAAGRTMVLLSGGEKRGDDYVLHKVDVALQAGVTGFIFGRNIWQRPFKEALAISAQMKERLLKHGPSKAYSHLDR